MKKHIITGVVKNSPADKMGICPGQYLLTVDGREIVDVFDYRLLCACKEPLLQLESIEKGNSNVVLSKDEYEDTGLIFEDSMMDDAKNCNNNCIFCFIDQLPEGLRQSLYFKDDDTRLSFLTGNYVTLTNISESELDRIIGHKLSPINISVHSTDSIIRTKMLRNKNAGNILEKIKKITQAGITVNCQIVLLRDVNDGEDLDRTLESLTALYPEVASISVVPVGLTSHREGLEKLAPFDSISSEKIVKQVSKLQDLMYERHGSVVVWLADEFYFKTGIEIPEISHYEDFPQIENGVGMFSLFRDEFNKVIKAVTESLVKSKSGVRAFKVHRPRKISIVTGEICFEILSGMVLELERLVNVIFGDGSLIVNVYGIENRFFGRQVTVSGLLTGTDVLSQLAGKDIGTELLLPENMFKAGENIMLDDTDLDTISLKLGVRAIKVKNNGSTFLHRILGGELKQALFGHKYSFAKKINDKEDI